MSTQRSQPCTCAHYNGMRLGPNSAGCSVHSGRTAPELTAHDPDVCTYCKGLGLTRDDWTKAMGGNR